MIKIECRYNFKSILTRTYIMLILLKEESNYLQFSVSTFWSPELKNLVKGIYNKRENIDTKKKKNHSTRKKVI